MTITAWMYTFPNLEPVHCSISSSNCYFLTCIQISQEAGKVVWCSHLLKNFSTVFCDLQSQRSALYLWALLKLLIVVKLHWPCHCAVGRPETEKKYLTCPRSHRGTRMSSWVDLIQIQWPFHCTMQRVGKFFFLMQRGGWWEGDGAQEEKDCPVGCTE